MYIIKIQISNLTLKFDLDYEIQIPEHFIPFLSDAEADYEIHVKQVEELPDPEGKCSYRGEFFDSYLKDHEERYFHPDFQHKDDNYLMVSHYFDRKVIDIRYLKSAARYIDALSNLFFHIGLEEIFMQENRMILHSCCIRTEIGGLLFSGPSGIGKSTQGELWKKYEKALLINGDRSVLCKKEDKWLAWGSPYAGSSNCYVQDYAPIRAIIMLEQSSKCTIKRLGAAEAYRKIYAMLTVCDWNPEFMERLLIQLELLISEVPVYLMACTPDKKAVDLLKNTLLEDKA